MLKKCLKYDLKSIWNVWWIIAVSVLAVGILGCVCIRGLNDLTRGGADMDPSLRTVLEITMTLTSGLAGLGLAAFITVTEILVFLRFYRNFFTDEGYLTFTLPVPRRTLYLSKTLNTVIWTTAAFGVVAVIVLIGLWICPSTLKLTDIWTGLPDESPQVIVGPFNLIAFKTIGDGFTAMWEDVGAWLIVYIAEALLALVLLDLFEVGLIQMCITIGSVIAKKHKLLASIGICYAVTTAVTTTAEVLFMISLFGMVDGADILFADLSLGAGCGVIALVMLLACVVLAILSTILHFIALGNVERRLNLA